MSLLQELNLQRSFLTKNSLIQITIGFQKRFKFPIFSTYNDQQQMFKCFILANCINIRNNRNLIHKLNQFGYSKQAIQQVFYIQFFDQTKCGLGQMENNKLALMKYPKDMLLKEIVLIYWSDLLVYSNFLSKEILKLLDYYKQLPVNICLQFYELYLELIQIKNQLVELYKYKKHFDRDNVIKEPKLFQVQKPMDDQIKCYVKKLDMREQGRYTARSYNEINSIKTEQDGQSFNQRVNLKLQKYQSSSHNGEMIDLRQAKTQRTVIYEEKEGEDEDFQQLKQILEKQNLQQRLEQQKSQQQQQEQQQKQGQLEQE